jgi:hypothetical protein
MKNTARLYSSAQKETTVVQLSKGELLRLPHRESFAELRIVSGSAWLTSEGRTEDIVLRIGDEFSLEGHKGILIEALADLTVEIISAEKIVGQNRSTTAPRANRTRTSEQRKAL